MQQGKITKSKPKTAQNAIMLHCCNATNTAYAYFLAMCLKINLRMIIVCTLWFYQALLFRSSFR